MHGSETSKFVTSGVFLKTSSWHRRCCIRADCKGKLYASIRPQGFRLASKRLEFSFCFFFSFQNYPACTLRYIYSVRLNWIDKFFHEHYSSASTKSDHFLDPTANGWSLGRRPKKSNTISERAVHRPDRPSYSGGKVKTNLYVLYVTEPHELVKIFVQHAISSTEGLQGR